ncbi:MAG: methionine--tRNA ligase [Pseudomonadota bacterium]
MPGAPYYITTPIYYVNDVPHIGHAYTSIAADVLARFYRLFGHEVFFLTGTDEHGQKIERAAEKKGVSPQQFVDDVAEHFRDLSQMLNLSEDYFIRTTDAGHKKAAQALWSKLADNGQIYQSTYAGWYSVRDETFYTESELVDGKAPTGAEVEWIEEPSYFFKLSEWQEPLLRFYAENPDFIGPKTRRNEVMRFVEGGLRDLSISRSTFKWGVPVPGDTGHVMYVWLDALTNYLSALGYPDVQTPKYINFWPSATHLVGKDILRHHAIYWPAFLLAAGLEPPKRIFAHGWWTKDGNKMSKSIGNTVDPFELVQQYGADQVRYFLMREVPFGKDGDFSDAAFIQRINSDLANDFGNLVQRVLSFVQKHAGAQVPQPGKLHDGDKTFLQQIKELPEELKILAKQQSLSKMCEAIWVCVGRANRYIDREQPWSLRKTDVERMQTVLFVLMEAIFYLAVLALPVIPQASERFLDFLSIPDSQRDLMALGGEVLIPGTPLPVPEPVFPRFEKAA